MMTFSRSTLVLAAGIFLVLAGHGARAQTGTERIVTGTSRPVFLTAPAGDNQRIFVAEQHTGKINIYDRDSGAMAGEFLDLDGLATGNEQGLLGLAFDPDYANNGYLYVNVTTTAGSGDTHIRRYRVQGDPATSNVADASSEFEILSFNQPQGNHNGGWIGFGPNDGALYIATGDGGGSDDNDSGHTAGSGNAQDITDNLLGKILRLDLSGDDFPDDANRNYAIPASNPFVGVSGDDEIWAYGLRNPYRSSFDRATGDLWIGDVGQVNREEIDFQPADSGGGENYGWRLREGTIATPTGGVGGPPPAGNVEPLYDYDRSNSDFGGRVVIGGYLYRGPVAAFAGQYFFADASSRNIWKLDPLAVDIRASVTRVNDLLIPAAGTIGSLSSFSEDAAGNLYLLELFSGEVFRVTTASQDIAWNGDDPTAGVAGNGTAWGDPNNWTRGGVADQPFVDQDNLVFIAGSAVPNINLESDRTAAAVTFEASYRLFNNKLNVLSGNITVDAGVTARIDSTLEAESANQSLRKRGAGTLLVNGPTGQTVVLAGTLGGTGTLANLRVQQEGTVGPGAKGPSADAIGTLSVTGDYSMAAGSKLAIELGGTAAGQFDRLEVTGAAQLGGTLRVDLVDLGGGAYQPQAGDSIPFLSSLGGVGGTFDLLDLPELGSHLEWLLNPDGNTIFLLVNSTLEADFNNDGLVDTADLALWQTGFGTAGGAGRTDGDADGDLDSDGADFLVWQQQFGLTAGPLATSVGVPEPSSLVLLFGWVACALIRRP